MECVFSEDRVYRYTLKRIIPVTFSFDERPWKGSTVQFIGLNPSTADETKDDPTIRRLRDFASQWGFTRMVMTNLFAFRATDPKDMKRHELPIGPENDAWLQKTASDPDTGLVVACWGNHGAHMGRSAAVRAYLKNLHCFRVTGASEPEHPLYLRADMKPIPL